MAYLDIEDITKTIMETDTTGMSKDRQTESSTVKSTMCEAEDLLQR